MSRNTTSMIRTTTTDTIDLDALAHQAPATDELLQLADWLHVNGPAHLSAIEQIELAERLITRRRFLIGAGALGLGAITGCRSQEEAVGPTVASGTRIFVDDLGRQVVIPTNPQRIVALHDYQNAIPLISIGAPVVGTSYRGDDFNPVLKTYDISGLESTGHIWEQSLETIAALQPDLIVGNAWQSAPNPDSLAEAGVEDVAPTVWINTDGKVADVMQKYGNLTGLSDEVEVQRQEYEAALERVRIVVVDLSKFSYSAFYYNTGDGNVYVESEDFPSPIVDVAQDLGMQPIPLVVESLAEGEFRPAISVELLSELEADLLIYGNEDETEGELTELPTWVLLPAVQAGQAYQQPQDIGGPTYTELMKALEFFEPILREADSSVVDESSDWE